MSDQANTRKDELSDDQVRAWMDRYDLDGCLTLSEARCAIEDARTIEWAYDDGNTRSGDSGMGDDEVLVPKRLLSEIHGDYKAGLGVSQASYELFCQRGAMGKMPNSTWGSHCNSRIVELEKLLYSTPPPTTAASQGGEG